MVKSSSKPARKYVPRSEKDVDEHANQSGSKFDSIFKQNVDIWVPKMGDNTIRLLEPTWDDHRHYGYEIYVHNRVGADNSTYLCLNKMKRKACPMCEAALEAKRAGEEDDAKQFIPQKRFVCWVLDRADRDPNPQVYSMPWTTDRDIAALCKSKRTGKILFVDHPYEGYDVSFTRKSGPNGIKLDSGFQIDHEATPLMDDDKKLEEIREFITENPVPDQLKFYAYEYLKQVIGATNEEKDEELDEENDNRYEGNTAHKKRVEDEYESEEDERPKRPRSIHEDEEDEEDEPLKQEDVDELEEEPPQAKKKVTITRVKGHPMEEDDDPPFEEDDDEEDSPPPSKTKRRR